MSSFELSPDDSYNRALIGQVRPQNWQNPTPRGYYHLVVVGGGSAGLISAMGASGLGAKVALIEKNLLGGDCLNTGCVPSKALIRSAKAIYDALDTEEFGLPLRDKTTISFEAVMERVRRLRSVISHHDSAEKLRAQGIDVYFGNPEFSSPKTINVNDATLSFKKAVIATGSRAAVPPIPGLKDVPMLTNETVFNLESRPAHLIVIGGGPIGCELAQAFRRLGSEVSIVNDVAHLLPADEPEAGELIAQRFKHEKIKLFMKARINAVTRKDAGIELVLTHDGASKVLQGSHVLVAAGRAPNIDGLKLEEAHVKATAPLGIQVNDRMQTSNPKIYAAGDCCLAPKFTHTADATARIVIQNSLFWGRKKFKTLTIPWCTYTDPEVAHTGATTGTLKPNSYDVLKIPLTSTDRANLDSDHEGFAKIITRKKSDQILGATIVARHAGDMINPLTLAIQKKIGLSQFASIIFPYPTQGELIKKVADQYQRQKLTPLVKAFLKFWFFIR